MIEDESRESGLDICTFSSATSLQVILLKVQLCRPDPVFVSYLDQNTNLLMPGFSVLENFLHLNPDANENHAYRCLAQFLFKNTFAHKFVYELSGGEKLRALLACVLMAKHPPQLLILDEPTNHLDLQSINSIESALKNYNGAMIVISHDYRFLEKIDASIYIKAPFGFDSE